MCPTCWWWATAPDGSTHFEAVVRPQQIEQWHEPLTRGFLPHAASPAHKSAYQLTPRSTASGTFCKQHPDCLRSVEDREPPSPPPLLILQNARRNLSCVPSPKVSPRLGSREPLSVKLSVGPLNPEYTSSKQSRPRPFSTRGHVFHMCSDSGWLLPLRIHQNCRAIDSVVPELVIRTLRCRCHQLSHIRVSL